MFATIPPGDFPTHTLLSKPESLRKDHLIKCDSAAALGGVQDASKSDV